MIQIQPQVLSNYKQIKAKARKAFKSIEINGAEFDL